MYQPPMANQGGNLSSKYQQQSSVRSGASAVPPRAAPASGREHLYSPGAASIGQQLNLDDLHSGSHTHSQYIMPNTPMNPPQHSALVQHPTNRLLSTQNLAGGGNATVQSQRNLNSVNNLMQTQLTNQTMHTVHSKTPVQQQSRFRKDDFEMGYILQSKGDRELVYIARKKFN